MIQLYNRHSASVWRKLALAALLSAAGSTSALAQSLNYTAAGATNLAGTYTDLGTNGTAITTTDLDNANSTAQPIGFTFNYNGQAFTQFVLNTNGWLKLGNTAPSNALGTYEYLSDVFSTSNPADQNIIAALGADLIGTAAAGSEYRVATTGTAPNRVCTIQWKNVADKALTLASGPVPAQYSSVNFQVKLYETTNVVELVYGSFTAASTGAVAGRGANAGLKGNNSVSNQVLLVDKASAAAWSTTTFLNTLYNFPAQGFYFNRNVIPDAGRTIRFTPGQAVANDSEVQRVYTLAKVPAAAGSPHTVRALIRNLGSNAQTNIVARLVVTGANSFTNNQPIASIPVGGSATVTFDPYSLANVGTNTVRVELVLADDDLTNNSRSVTQEVTTNTFSYAASGPATSAVGFGAGATASAAAFATRYTTSVPRSLTSITAFIYNDPASVAVGKTVYAAVLSSTGTLLGRTPDYVVTAADANARKTFTFATPVALPAGDFLAAFVQTNAANGGNYFPMGTQNEDPTRTGAFFTISPFNPATGGTPADASVRNFGIYMIEADLSVTTGTSKALEAAVSVYPNPSNGDLTLDVRGAKARNGLTVEVNNLLGQRVYAGAVRDNFENKLGLSHLPKGLYTVKVKDGEQYMLRTISITK